MFKKIIFTIVSLLIVILLAFVIRGNRGNPIAYQSGYDLRVGGPFEASNSSARYALTEAIVEDHTFELNTTRAKAASPDVVKANGKYYSIFTPGVSFASIPFYLIGRYFGIPQIGAYLSVFIATLINFILIFVLSKKIGAGFWGSLIGSFTFIFATNSLSYSQTLTQHSMSVTAILTGLLLASGKPKFIKNFLFGLTAGVALLLDAPAFIFMIPSAFYLVVKNSTVRSSYQSIKISIKPILVGILIGFLPLLLLFFVYNKSTIGSYTTLAQSIGRTSDFSNIKIKEDKNSGREKKQNMLEAPFNPRFQLQGFYILLLSNERSWLFYSPIVLLGAIGLIMSYNKNKNNSIISVIASIILLNIVLYSMFGDPWGGWAFGPRYLIPSAALLCSFLGFSFTYSKKVVKYLFLIIFLILLVYSIHTNVIGVLTTNNIPPKIEAERLQSPTPYTQEYNQQILDKNEASSLLYNFYLSTYLTARDYSRLYTIVLSIIGIVLTFLTFVQKENNT